MNMAKIFFDSATEETFSKVINRNYYKKSEVDDCAVVDNAFILPTKKKKEQIIVMKNAECLAGISGTGMHMALFADDGIDITILERTDNPVPEQTIINQAIGANAFIPLKKLIK